MYKWKVVAAVGTVGALVASYLLSKRYMCIFDCIPSGSHAFLCQKSSGRLNQKNRRAAKNRTNVHEVRAATAESVIRDRKMCDMEPRSSQPRQRFPTEPPDKTHWWCVKC